MKLTSNEGGAFDAQNNRVSFDIPAGRMFDLSTAYLNLVMSVPCNNEGGVGCYIPVIRFANSAGTAEDIVYDNSALIRSVKMDCELRGSIEDIQRCDILTHNLNNYSKSRFNQTSQLYERLCSEFAVSRTKGSIFNELHKEGNVPSRLLSRVPVRIKMSDIMNFCKTTQYNTGKYGKTRLELELNLDKLATPIQYLPANSSNDWVMANSADLPVATLAENKGFPSVLVPVVTADALAKLGSGAQLPQNQCFKMMNAVNVTAATANYYSTGRVSNNYKTFYPAQDLAAGQGTTTSGGMVPRIFNRLEDSPFYVGQRLLVNSVGVGLGGNDADQVAIIERIDYNRGDGAGFSPATNPTGGGVDVPGTIAITLQTALPGTAASPAVPAGAAANGKTDIIFSGALASFEVPRCDYAELILEELTPANVQPEPDTITYSTYKTEEIDCAGTTNFQHQFMGHPNAVTMYITQPAIENGTARCIQSKQNQVESYRIRVNNKDTSSRKIFLRGRNNAGAGGRGLANDPLHTHKQQSALVNSDRLVKNLNEQALSITSNTGLSKDAFGSGTEAGNMLIGQVLPLTQMPKTIQVNIDAGNGGGGIANLAVFQEVVKEI